MSALTIMVKTLLASSVVRGMVANAGGTRWRIYPVRADQTAAYPNIVIHLISSGEEELLAGATQWPEARVSIECRASAGEGEPIVGADRLAEAVIDWLRDKDRYLIDGCEVKIRKEGSDETDSSDSSTQGVPDVVRRIVDYYVRWRRISP